MPGTIAKTDRVEEFQAVPWIRPPHREHRHKNVLERCELREQVVGLVDEPDALVAIERCRRARQASDVRSADNNLAAIGAVQCRHKIEQRGLA